MDTYSVNGFGLFAIQGNNGRLLVFSDSRTQLSWETVGEEDEDTENNILDPDDIAYRALLSVEITTVGQVNGHKDLIELVNILNSLHYTIYPNYDSEIPLSRHFILDGSYDMKEADDNLTIEQVTQCFEAGQAINVKFKARKPVDTRRTLSNNPDEWDEISLGYGGLSGSGSIIN